MNHLIDDFRAADPSTIAEFEELAEAAKSAIPDARRAAKTAKAEADIAHRKGVSARARQTARKAELDELATRVEQAVFIDSPDAGQLVEQHVHAMAYYDQLTKAVTRFEAYEEREAIRRVIEAELGTLQLELRQTEALHNSLLYRLLLGVKQLALENGGQVELSEDQFSNGRVGELRAEVGGLYKKVDGLRNKLLAHDQTSERMKQEIHKYD